MTFESVAKQTLRRQMRAPDGQLRSLANKALLLRIWRFASRHHGRLVVEGGRVVERGTHRQLLTRGGRCAELCQTQFGDDSAAASLRHEASRYSVVFMS